MKTKLLSKKNQEKTHLANLVTLFFFFFISTQIMFAQITEAQVRTQINELEDLISRAERLNIETVKEKMNIRVAEIFLIYAEWDENNIDLNESEFSDHRTLPPSETQMTATELANTIFHFERSEVSLLLSESIDELKKIIAGTRSRKSTFNPEWNEFEYVGSRLTQNGKPTFGYTWNFMKDTANDFSLSEYFGRIGGFYYHPNMLIRDSNGEIKLADWVENKLNTMDKTQVGVPFLGRSTYNGVFKDEFPEITQGASEAMGFDIDHPQAKVMHAVLLEKVVPQFKGTKFNKIGYLLANEPNFNWSGNWQLMGISDITREKFKNWLIDKHQNISNLNSAWGNSSSFNSFQQAVNSVSTPIDKSIRGSGRWYDTMRFNQIRVIEWFTFLHNEVKKHDNDAKTFIKNIPDYWSTSGRHQGIDMEALTGLTDIIGNDAKTIKDVHWGEGPTQGYNMSWENMASAFDFFRSVSPNKVNYNSETHSLWSQRSFNLFYKPGYAISSHWFSRIHGCDLDASWLFARDRDGSFSDRFPFPGTAGQQPRIFNAVHASTLDHVRYAEEISLIQDQDMPIRMFYSETSAINRESYMPNLKKTYSDLYFEGYQLGFVTEKIIKNQNNLDWKVVVISDTDRVTTKELESLQSYLNRGGTIIKDSESLREDEYGKPHTITLNSGSGTLITTSNTNLSQSTFSNIQQKGIFPAATLKDAKENKIMIRSIKMPNGNSIASLIHLGSEESTATLQINGNEEVSIIDLLKGIEIENSITMKPHDVLFIELKPKDATPLSSGQFDFGTAVSPVEIEHVKVHPTTTPTTNGAYGWLNTTGLIGRDRGDLNDLNRDLVFSSQTRLFEVNVNNGIYKVTVTLGDKNFRYDNMVIKSENNIINNDIDTNANEFKEVTFNTIVNDNKLSLEFSNNGGGNNTNWVINRVVFELDDTLSTNDQDDLLDNSISIFPNPVQDKLNIYTELSQNLEYTITNTIGQVILNGNLPQKENTININGIPSGLYIISLKDSDSNKVIKTTKLLVSK